MVFRDIKQKQDSTFSLGLSAMLCSFVALAACGPDESPSDEVIADASTAPSDAGVTPKPDRADTGLDRDSGMPPGMDAGMTMDAEPEPTAPPLDNTVTPSPWSIVEHVVSTQPGYQEGSIEKPRVAYLAGQVVNRDGTAIEGAKVQAKGQDNVGWGETDSEGRFEFVFNGGGEVVFNVSAEQYLPIQLQQKMAWGGFRTLDPVVLTAPDSATTMVMAGSTQPVTHTASMVSDDRGDRQVSMTFRAGTMADMILPDGSSQALSAMTIRATEYTVGPNGHAAMPGPLEGGVAYTYAVELSVDEAMNAGAETVTFSQPVAVHLENFIDVPVGTIVPVGTYSRSRSMWIPNEDGIILGVVGVTNGMAELDLDGDGTEDADDYTLWGIDDVEREAIASRFGTGQSLTRVQRTSFSPIDFNYFGSPRPFGISRRFFPVGSRRNGTRVPRNAWERREAALREACEQNGSIIHCQNRALSEIVEIPSFGDLYYSSDRVEGYTNDYELTIPLLDESYRADITKVDVRVTVAGQRIHEETVPAAPNASVKVSWDGRDGFGRKLNGIHLADIQLVYWIETQYQYVSSCSGCGPGRSFGSRASGSVTVSTDSIENPTFVNLDAYLGSWQVEEQGLGAWSLADHHSYDPRAQVLVKGTGEIETTSGRQTTRVPLELSGTPDFALALPDGTFVINDSEDIYFTRLNQQPRAFVAPQSVDLMRKGPNGSIITAHNNRGCTSGRCGFLRQMDPDGTWRLLAGNGNACQEPIGCGIGELAVDSPLGEILAAETAPDGSIYFIEKNRLPSDFTMVLRRLTADGRLQSLTTGTSPLGSGVQNISDVKLESSQRGDVAIASDGTVYFFVGTTSWTSARDLTTSGPSDSVWSFNNSGQLQHVLGGTQPRGSGVPASATRVGLISDIEITSDNELFVHTIEQYDTRGVFSVANDVITDLAGDFYNRTAFCVSNGVGNELISGPNGALYCYLDDRGDWVQFRTIRGGQRDVAYRVPDLGDNAIFEFDEDGRHLRTLNLLTGDERMRFDYDSNGHLSEIMTEAGPLAVERNADGRVTALVGLGDTRTTIQVTDEGLMSVTDPMGRSHNFTYTAGDLLASYSDPAGRTNQFTYAANGFLDSDRGPDGGVQSLGMQTIDDGVYDVILTSAEGLEKRYRVDLRAALRTEVISPAGAVTEMLGDESRYLRAENGAEYITNGEPHPVYGGGPVFTYQALTKTPNGLLHELSRDVNVLYSSDPNAPFPANIETIYLDTRQNGDRASYSETTYYSDRVERVRTTAEFRTSSTVYGLDGRVRSQTRESLAPKTMTYDNRGWIQEVQQADQSLTFVHNAKGEVLSVTDARGTAETWTYDLAGVATSWTHAGQTYTYNHDAAGDLEEMVTPMGEVFGFAYDAAGRRNQISVPRVGPFSWTFDLDGKQTAFTLPSGDVISDTYDAGGRYSGWSYPEGSATITYRGKTKDPASLTNNPQNGPANTMAFEYDGPYPIRMSTTGTVSSDFHYTYDNKLRIVSYTRQIDTSLPETITIERDRDGLVTRLGDLQLTYPSTDSIPSMLQIGDLTQTTTYDNLGRVQNQAFTAGGTQFEHAFTFDSVGRIVGRIETLDGTVTELQYNYDDQDQLLSVVEDPNGAATTVESYQYDADGNRTASHRGAASYDGHLITNLEGTAITTDANGSITAIGALQLNYNARRELQSATSGATSISYTYDAIGRRVTASNGTDTWSYVYGNLAALHEVTAVRQPSGTIVWHDYAPDGRLMGLKIGTERYEVISDVLGSPRMVFYQGALIKSVTYDAYGVVLSDSNPSFHLAIGFAGGLNDPFTSLQRFWFRDYSPEAGRWTSLDPAFFSGDKRNLYLYVGNNPVSRRDPKGLFCIGASTYAGIGGGAKYCRKTDPKTGITKNSLCFEVGLGVGGGVEVAPFADTDPMGENVLVSLGGGVSYGPIGAGVGLEYKLTNCGDLETKKSASLGPIGHESVRKKFGQDGTGVKASSVGLKKKLSLEAEAKVAVEFCEAF